MKSQLIIDAENTRIDYVDTVKFIGIFLLLIDHTSLFADLNGGGYFQLKTWICSFHMPLFFVISGVVVGNKQLHSFTAWKGYVTKKIKALLVPYVIWTLIYSQDFDSRFFIGVLYASNPSLSYANTNAVFWFLPVMFICTLIYQMLLNLSEQNVGIKIYVPIISIFILASKMGSNIDGMRLPWGIDIAFVGTSFMIMGRYIVRPFISSIKTRRGMMAVLFLCISIVIAIVNKPLNGPFKVNVMALAEYGNSIVLFVLGGVVSTIFICIVSKYVKNKLFSYLGRHSLLIMAVHYILFPLTLRLTQALFETSHQLTILFSITNALFATALCIPICYIVDSFCPCLNGK